MYKWFFDWQDIKKDKNNKSQRNKNNDAEQNNENKKYEDD